MSVLLVDIGNTRIKWARLTSAGLPGRGGAACHAGWKSPQFASALFRPGHRVERVLAVSVAEAGVERAFERATRRATGIAPEFVRSARRAAGVTNGYREPWRLGADRWVALIGARALCGAGKAVCVIDVGTAVTVDLLDPQGRHLGGAIVPGPALMVQALLQATGGIRRRAGPNAAGRRARTPTDLFARSTRDGLAAGAAHAVAAVIDRAALQARERLRAARLGRRTVTPLLLLTGGAAAALSPRVSAAHRVEADLVLRGLAELAYNA
jgi:type III pantothenate kinase